MGKELARYERRLEEVQEELRKAEAHWRRVLQEYAETKRGNK